MEARGDRQVFLPVGPPPVGTAAALGPGFRGLVYAQSEPQAAAVINRPTAPKRKRRPCELCVCGAGGGGQVP